MLSTSCLSACLQRPRPARVSQVKLPVAITYRNAARPVMACPMISVCTSSVPS
jgi:hypothetical protein